MTAPSLFGDRAETSAAALQLTEPPSLLPAAVRVEPTSSLYRKYRPQSFAGDELVGQDHVVRTLRNAVRLDRVGHAYLFSGPRGTGKTTTARLLAKAVNCLAPDPGHRPCNACANCVAINAGASPDVIEIDAASNRGIDDIRDLRERVRYAPAQLRSKVYIIDEAHQITGAAANAFLKTLEEPPEHTRFILATTDPEELLPTIVSRCQRFEFRRVSAEQMVRRLRTVADREEIHITDDALLVVARQATGSLRDALGLLEQLALSAAAPTSTSGPLTIDVGDVRAALGLSRNDRIEGLVAALSRRSAEDALRIVQESVDDGEDPRQLNRQLLAYLRLLLLARAGGANEIDDRTRELASGFSLAQLAGLARQFGEIDFAIKHAPLPQLPLEVALVEAAANGPAAPADASHGEGAPNRPPAGDAPSPTFLRDRVRGHSSSPLARASEPAAIRGNPAPITPLRTADEHPTATVAIAADGGQFEVGQVADLWPRVRADVKAVNRRIEALLSEVDPVAVSGNLITLAVPYPFHRDKLNTDEVRNTVAAALSRILQREISLVCILRGEISASSPERETPGRDAVESTIACNESSTEDEEHARMLIRAAKNIFDAEEIDGGSEIAASGPGIER